MTERTDHWTLDRKVPITIIFALLAQTAGALWWAAKVDGRITDLDEKLGFNEVTDRRQYDVMRGDREKFQKSIASINELIAKQAIQIGSIKQLTDSGILPIAERRLSLLEGELRSDIRNLTTGQNRILQQLNTLQNQRQNKE